MCFFFRTTVNRYRKTENVISEPQHGRNKIVLRAYLPSVIAGLVAVFTPDKLAFLPDVAGRPGNQWWPQYAVPDWIHFFVPLLAICYVMSVAIIRVIAYPARGRQSPVPAGHTPAEANN